MGRARRESIGDRQAAEGRQRTRPLFHADEEKRLRDALAQRDRDGIAARDSGNEWRRARSNALLPTLPAGGYFDHLTPMVLLALNSGLRRGELTALDWTDVNFPAKSLHVRAAAAKSGISRDVPLNKETGSILTRWQRQTGNVGRVFNVRDVKTAWLALMRDAKLDGFNFHDLRHSFASALVWRASTSTPFANSSGTPT